MNFRSTETKEAFWMIAMIAIAFGVIIPFGGLSRAIFCALCLGAVWLSCRLSISGFLPFHQTLGSPARPHPQRLWRVFVEVILQYRVVRDRPLVGILHAAVVWGFLVFAWVSAEHLFLGVWGP